MLRTAQASFSRNRLLSAMAGDDFSRLRPHLTRIPLTVRHVIEEAGEPIVFVVFPEPSVVSVVAVSAIGQRSEVGVFGPDGMSGVALLHGADRSPLRTFVQVAGSGLRIPADELRSALADSPSLRDLLLRWAQAFAVQVAFTALANGRYTLHERLSRWLLMCHDRLDEDVILLTHEFLGVMLGVRRAGVTTALKALEDAGLIRATRGRIRVLDRSGLQSAANDSYGVPEMEYERLLGG